MSEGPVVAIAGGSLAGLMVGLELRAVGAEVSIHERSPHALDDRGAGIVMQPETLRILTEHRGMKEEESGIWLRYRQFLGADGKPVSHQTMPQLMTSWGLLYRALRGAFPEELYHEGSPLTAFSSDDTGVTARFGDVDEARVDILVGADGSRSFVRQQLMPEVKPRYAGYVAWRGVINEGEVDSRLLRTFDDHFTFQQMAHSHILCYVIPGAGGELERGRRRLNWVWYWNVAETELPLLMTGRDGRRRDFSMPLGQVKEEFITQQSELARKLLAPPFQELWAATSEPFIQPIVDLGVPRMVFGRIALLGDAAFIPRPHTAASTSKAAENAATLAAALSSHRSDLTAALRVWEPAQLALGQRLEAYGQMLGDRSQFGRSG